MHHHAIFVINELLIEPELRSPNLQGMEICMNGRPLLPMVSSTSGAINLNDVCISFIYDKVGLGVKSMNDN
eukprot:snap_masked-scaffold_5-processed-gene-11.7-mRNA-1 protein AED:1.00 eAED:1.00 QI:0/-1/0/0/-1/1/1/0/70